ncbi:MAG: hypothetical protein GTO63_35325, partial [Anaerolineae bacterium]|nr:hypothetical protein [Anaerolineae bacterium]NIN96677.1 hypothetical protein [Anaerolineae bacterium]NIQ82733.1 hypothetical protein [Anaerolineae bacterium]
AAILAGMTAGSDSEEGVEHDHGILIPTDRSMTNRVVHVPTTLGGDPLIRACWDNEGMVVYDCAHTCHPQMFEEVQWGPQLFAVLSFFPTKP